MVKTELLPTEVILNQEANHFSSPLQTRSSILVCKGCMVVRLIMWPMGVTRLLSG
jgi:hypothetical protein